MRGLPLPHLLAGRAQFLGVGSAGALWRALDSVEGPQYHRGDVTPW